MDKKEKRPTVLFLTLALVGLAYTVKPKNYYQIGIISIVLIMPVSLIQNAKKKVLFTAL